jgi:hypothetical protein
MKFVLEKAGSHSEDSLRFGVLVDFNSAAELPYEGPRKLLALFLNREDAEAYKARKEKEYRA